MSDEYDAFGRKRDEAGLGDLGWGSSGDPDTAGKPDPVTTPAPTTTAAAAESGFSGPQEFRTAVTTSSASNSWRPKRSPVVWLVQLAILGAVGFGIYSVVDAGNDAVRGVRDTFNALDDFGNGSASGSASGGRGSTTVPEQVEARKLFTEDGLRSAMRVMEREVPGRIFVMSIRRDRINAQIVQKNEAASVGFDADAEVPQVFSRSTAPGGGDTLSYEEVNLQAPFRLLKEANRRVNRSDADVDYFVVQSFSGDVQWGVYYEGGSPIVQGDSRGRLIRRIS